MNKTIVFTIILLFSVFQTRAENNSDSIRCDFDQMNVVRNTASCTDDYLEEMALAVNTVNNIISYTTLVIAILTFATIIVGFVGFKRLKTEIGSKKNEVDIKIKEVDNEMLIIESFKNQVMDVKRLIAAQDNYVSFSNGYLYQTTEQLVNQIADTRMAMEIYRTLVHNYHVANLYSSDDSNRFAALAYLREKGELADIDHLQKLLSSDIDQRYKNFASEIIGIIKFRNQP